MSRSTNRFVLAVLGVVGCAVPPPTRPSTAPRPAHDEQLQPSKTHPYNVIGNAIGVREGIEAGLLVDGDTMVFVASDPTTGRVLPKARLRIGEGDEARIIEADAEGRIEFPLELALTRSNPPVTVLSDVASPELNFAGTLHVQCDEIGGTKATKRRRLGEEDYDRLATEPAGLDIVYALEDGVTAEQRTTMAAGLIRLRATYTEVTGWDPPPMAVLLTTSDPRELVPIDDRDGRKVWALGVLEIDSRERAVALLAHEWTHASLRAHAPASRSGDLTSRWIEDGLCELVAHEVERELFPDRPSHTLTSRTADLAEHDGDIPAEVDLLSFSAPARASMYGQLAAMCDAGTVFGYAYALAFWHAVDLDRTQLHGMLEALTTSTLVEQAEHHAPPGMRHLKLERTCALAVLRGDRSCAMR